MLGYGFSALYRQSAMAIGIGSVYVLVVENLVFGLLVNLGDAFKQIQEWFPVANAGYLQYAFGRVNAAAAAAVSSPPVSATHGKLSRVVDRPVMITRPSSGLRTRP
jgi:hypothetical protein